MYVMVEMSCSDQQEPTDETPKKTHTCKDDESEAEAVSSMT